jgi:hypothetical protein
MCRQGHLDYTTSGVDSRHWCRACASNAARARYEIVRAAASTVGMSVRDYKSVYTSRIETAVAVLEGKDPLGR